MGEAQITIPLTLTVGTATTAAGLDVSVRDQSGVTLEQRSGISDRFVAISPNVSAGTGVEMTGIEVPPDGTVVELAVLPTERHEYTDNGDGGELLEAHPGFSFSDFAITAAANGEQAWTATLCIEGVPTVDSGTKRMLAPGGGDWLPLPLPLAIMYDSPHADGPNDAPVCGRIDQIWRAGNRYQAAGVFGSDDVGAKAAGYVADKLITGVSIDPVDVTMERMLYANGGIVSLPTVEDPDDAGGMMDAPADEDEVVEDYSMEVLYVFTSYKIAGATICPVQALTDATISIVAGGSDRLTNETEWTLAESLTASATMAEAPLNPPAEWFENPHLDKPSLITVTEEGRVFGHVAPWRGCHTGYVGRCVPPPRSRTGYAGFHVGRIETADGDLLRIGKLTLASGHADLNMTSAEARSHYDNTSTVAAFVRAGEDEHGIWVAGCLRRKVPGEMIQDLMANPLSGDWRNGEMISAHAVPVPGYPILQASAIGEDGSEETSLILTSTIGLFEDDAVVDLPLRARVLKARASGGIQGLAELARQ